MNNYEDSERGVFQSKEYAKQLVSFEDFLLKGRLGKFNVTPTDIDGFVQLDNENCFIFFELKFSGDAPQGQFDALKRLADAVQKGGSNCVLFVAEHKTPLPETILAKNATVKTIYWNGIEYHDKEPRSLYKAVNDFINYINGEVN